MWTGTHLGKLLLPHTLSVGLCGSETASSNPDRISRQPACPTRPLSACSGTGLHRGTEDNPRAGHEASKRARLPPRLRYEPARDTLRPAGLASLPSEEPDHAARC